MKTVAQLLAAFLFLFWFIVAGTAPMMLGAPRASNQLKNLLFVAAVVSYPLVIGVVFFLLNWNLWFLSPRAVLIVSLVAPATAVFFLGRPIVNSMCGIANEGDTITKDSVYASGKKISGADPQSFRRLNAGYARDDKRVYSDRGAGNIIVVDGADAASFEIVDAQGVEPPYDACDRHRRYLAGKPL